MECVVDQCQGDPSERLTVNHDWLLVEYAICRPHAIAVRDGASVAAPDDPTRGMIRPLAN